MALKSFPSANSKANNLYLGKKRQREGLTGSQHGPGMSYFLKILQPQAVWQLVVLALMVVVAPLAWLLYSTAISLQTLTLDSRQVTQESVMLAESGRSARAALIDMERIARQYIVLEDKSLLDLYATTANALLTPLETIGRVLAANEAQALLADINQAEEQLAETLEVAPPKSVELINSLSEISAMQTGLDQLLQLTRNYSESRLGALGHKAAEVRQGVFQSALFLVPVTLLLIALFTVLIVRPIGRLQLAIRRLGNGQPRPIRLYGPVELVKLAEELNTLQDRLAQVEEQKQQFLRHVSHELKTPLSSIREGTSLLQDELVGPLSAPQREVVRLVDENGKQLQKLIENLLQFNRLNYDAQANHKHGSLSSPNRPSQFDLNELAAEVLQQHWLRLSQSGQKLCLGGPPVTLAADRERIATTLDNLVSNAIAYGTKNGKIWILWNPNDTGLEIQVRNIGTPIAPAEVQHIFEPFYQGSMRRSGAVKGSGIGLSVARECIHAQGGELILSANQPNNICFSIRLPVEVLQERSDLSEFTQGTFGPVI